MADKDTRLLLVNQSPLTRLLNPVAETDRKLMRALAIDGRRTQNLGAAQL